MHTASDFVAPPKASSAPNPRPSPALICASCGIAISRTRWSIYGVCVGLCGGTVAR